MRSNFYFSTCSQEFESKAGSGCGCEQLKDVCQEWKETTTKQSTKQMRNVTENATKAVGNVNYAKQ